MRKIFLAMALLVITASFLTGCAKEEALAGEAIALKGLTVGELETKLGKKLTFTEMLDGFETGQLSVLKVKMKVEGATDLQIEEFMTKVPDKELALLVQLADFAKNEQGKRMIAVNGELK